jgi:hypothetical protein
MIVASQAPRSKLTMKAWSQCMAIAVVATAACSDSSGPAGSGSVAQLSVISGSAQSGRVAAELKDEIVVRAVDGAGRPIPGVALTFEVMSGGGGVAPATSSTNDAGEARTRWILGTSTTVAQRLRIRTAAAAGGTFIEMIVAATAQPGPFAALVVVAGDAQTGTAGAPLPQDLVVRAADSHGNAIAGQSVRFAVESGSGSVASTLAATDSQGLAHSRWTLGTEAGSPQRVSAASEPAGNPSIEVAFTATGRAGPPQLVERVSGNAQAGDPGVALGQPLRVRVTDQHGNAVGSVTVQWTAQGGGTVITAGGLTDATGHAEAVWTLGLATSQTATASAAGGQAVFTATLNPPGPMANLTIVEGNAQSGIVGEELPRPIGVRATDAQGRPIAGQYVLFEVIAGDGSLFLGSASTGANGEARDRWWLGGLTGLTHRVRARAVDPATGAAREVVFTATPLPGPVDRISIISGNDQVAPFSVPLPLQLVVRATDRFGNSVPGVQITWTAMAGGGSANPATSLTDGGGWATTSWTLGPSGEQQLRATERTRDLLFVATGLPIPAGWTILPDMGAEVRSAAAASLDGRIHVLGGFRYGGRTNLHRIFDIAASTWGTGAALPEPLDNAMVVTSPAGLHLMGGSTAQGSTNRHWIYNPQANAWVAAPDLPRRRRAGGAAYVNGRIYLIGGLANDGDLIPAVDVYDVAARTWTTTTPLPTRRFQAGIAVVDGDIIVAGGSNLNGPLDGVAALNPETGTWRNLVRLREPVSAFGFGLLNGSLCVFGGVQPDRDTVWCRPIDGSSWQDVGTMPRARGELAYTVIGNSIYFFGGSRYGSVVYPYADRVTPFQ